MNRDASDRDSERFERALLPERERLVTHVGAVRLGAVAAWFLMAWGFGYGLDKPDWHAMAPIVSVYLAAALVLYAGVRFVPSVRFPALFAPAVVDVPMVFWIVWRVLAESPTPREASQFTIGVFGVLVVFAMLSLSRRVIWATSAAASAGEIALLRQAEITADTQVAAVVILATAAAAATFVVARVRRMVGAIAAEQTAHERMARHFSPQALDAMAGGAAATGRGERRRVTIVCADLPGLAGLSAHVDGQKIVAWLNDCLSEMVRVVFRHGGTLDRFTGGGLVGYFGGSHAALDHPRAALTCAVDLLRALDTINAARLARGEPALALAVGVHTGDVVMGEVGFEERREHAIVGEAVDVASRVMLHTKIAAVPLLASQTTYEELQTLYSWTTAGAIEVKGRPLALHAPSATLPAPAARRRATGVRLQAKRAPRAGEERRPG